MLDGMCLELAYYFGTSSFTAAMIFIKNKYHKKLFFWKTSEQVNKELPFKNLIIVQTLIQKYPRKSLDWPGLNHHQLNAQREKMIDAQIMNANSSSKK